MKWIGFLSALLLVISCFTPWVVITSKNIVVSGIDATGTNFGKPGYFHFLMAGLFIIFNFIQKIWAKRWNLLVVALNLAWAIRNFLIITVCEGGECPEKRTGLWLVILASVLMLIAALFPDIKLNPEKKANQEQ